MGDALLVVDNLGNLCPATVKEMVRALHDVHPGSTECRRCFSYVNKIVVFTQDQLDGTDDFAKRHTRCHRQGRRNQQQRLRLNLHRCLQRHDRTE